MVNNFTNINKMNNHLSPQITEHTRQYRYDIGNPSWDRYKNVAGLNHIYLAFYILYITLHA
jgi:hypothetical protein